MSLPVNCNYIPLLYLRDLPKCKKDVLKTAEVIGFI